MNPLPLYPTSFNIMQISSQIFDYLNQLKKNNNRDWFQENKLNFDEVYSEMKTFFHSIAAEVDFDQFERTKIFRIYRDVRFSKNKTPYKTHFSANFVRDGAERRGSYYVHIEPDNSWFACGFYQPEKDDLFRIRKEFEADDKPIRDIINDLSTMFPQGLMGDELKTAPRNFDKEHSAIDLIRKKSFYFMKTFTNDDVLSSSFPSKIIQCFRSSIPYLNYMSDVLTTDLNGESIL